jgi:hypothetical protein
MRRPGHLSMHDPSDAGCIAIHPAQNFFPAIHTFTPTQTFTEVAAEKYRFIMSMISVGYSFITATSRTKLGYGFPFGRYFFQAGGGFGRSLLRNRKGSCLIDDGHFDI